MSDVGGVTHPEADCNRGSQRGGKQFPAFVRVTVRTPDRILPDHPLAALALPGGVDRFILTQAKMEKLPVPKSSCG